MATDWAADVKKYAANADDAAIAGIVRYCGIALRNRDSAMVAFSDKTETDRVRTNFLQKKLALPNPQSELDAAIAKVGAAMKGDRTKNRVTVYYLLAQEFDQLAMFVSKKASNAATALPLAAVSAAPKPAAKVAPKPAAKVPAAKPVSAVPAVKPAAKAAKAPAAAVGAAAAAAAAKPAKTAAAKTAAAKPAATKPAAAKPAVVKAPVKAASAKPAAKQAAVTTKKSAPTKAAVSTAAAAPASTGTIAAATALGGAAIAAPAGGVEVVKDAAAKVAGLVSDTGSSTVVPSGSASSSVAAPASVTPKVATPAATPSDDDSGLGWLYWVLGGLVLLALLWFLFHRSPADETGAAAVPTEAAAVAVPPETPVSEAAAGDLAAAPAEGSGSVQIPTGAGVTSELRGDKPVVKVYFDTGKTDLAGAFAGAASGLKSYLSAHPGTVLNVSGYSDPSGNAAANAELSKNRAKAVQTALVAAGIPDASAMLVKPDNSADASVPKEAARRVEVVVK